MNIIYIAHKEKKPDIHFYPQGRKPKSDCNAQGVGEKKLPVFRSRHLLFLKRRKTTPPCVFSKQGPTEEKKKGCFCRDDIEKRGHLSHRGKYFWRNVYIARKKKGGKLRKNAIRHISSEVVLKEPIQKKKRSGSAARRLGKHTKRLFLKSRRGS